MRATGIIRRIDELGRIVIPREVRRSLGLKEGDPMEIFTDRDGQVIMQKYSPYGEAVTTLDALEAQTNSIDLGATDNKAVKEHLDSLRRLLTNDYDK